MSVQCLVSAATSVFEDTTTALAAQVLGQPPTPALSQLS